MICETGIFFLIPVKGSENYTKYNLLPLPWFVLRHKSFILRCFWITTADISTVGKGVSIIMKTVWKGLRLAGCHSPPWELLPWQSAFCGRFWEFWPAWGAPDRTPPLDWSASHDPWWGEGAWAAVTCGPPFASEDASSAVGV